MDRFLYCFDEQLKIKLIKNGFKLINETTFYNKNAWIFENNEKVLKFVNFDLSNKNKYVVTNMMNF